jgi:lipoprotein-releasing system permease protein
MIKKSYELFIALRYLRSKRREIFISIITVISVLGVALSVMVLDMVLSIMTGFEHTLQSKLFDANAHVVVRPIGGNLENTDAIIDKIKGVPGVVSVYPYTYNQAMITTADGSRGVLIRGVAQDPTPKAKLAKFLLHKGAEDKLFTSAPMEIERPDGSMDTVELPPLIIGKALRDRLGLGIGEAVTLLAPRFRASPQGLVPKLRRFVVVDIYKSGLIEYESGLAYSSMLDSQAFFDMDGRVTGVEIEVKKLSDAQRVAGLIRESIGEFGLFSVSDWTEQNKPLWDALRLEKRVYFIVLSLLILVASFSIVSTLVMLVMEKSKDIAILKTLGARSNGILALFLVQGAIIGFSGIVFGTLLGYLGCVILR